MPPTPSRPPLGPALAWALTIGLALLHGGAIVRGMGGWSGIKGPWPIARHDHPLYFHSAWVTRSFLAQSGTTAGYDPYFMSGYAKSVVFPASSTLPELVIAAFGRRDPVRAYKLYVLIGAALVPWLVAAAGAAWGLRARAIAAAVALHLVYVWTDFPIQYAWYGMIPYFLAVPLALLATAWLSNYFARGGFGRWLLASLGATLAALVHFTTLMVIAPAALLAYAVAVWATSKERKRVPSSRHLGATLIGWVLVLVNAFWWWPGIPLAHTKGASDFAFFHPEGVAQRLWQIVTTEAVAESVLLGLGLVGLAVMARLAPVVAAAVGGLMAAGAGWGYLAGASRALDFLQPGRHTYALYTAAALAGGVGLTEALGRLRAGGAWVERLGWVAVLLVGTRVFVPSLIGSYRAWLGGPEPFLSSRPSPALLWVVDRVRQHVRPGERLLYEEGGIDDPSIRFPGPDPFAFGRFSGLLPYYTGVECLGGPYLRSAVTTNFTQFGGGSLFGRKDWSVDHFERYAELYRPAAIVCWSRWARSFCRNNPELVEVLDDNGTLLIGRVRGYGGAAVRGKAEVKASAGRLEVSGVTAGLDGWLVLRYHSVPCLRSRPPVRLEAVLLEGDPVPFIGLRPPPGLGALSIELDVPAPWELGARPAAAQAVSEGGS